MTQIQVSGFRAALIASMMDPAKEPNTKKFLINDTDGDPTNIYTAQAFAQAGDECLEQVIAYETTASGIKAVQKIAWRNAVWSGTPWDIAA
jgi:hypothetical protein